MACLMLSLELSSPAVMARFTHWKGKYAEEMSGGIDFHTISAEINHYKSLLIILVFILTSLSSPTHWYSNFSMEPCMFLWK